MIVAQQLTKRFGDCTAVDDVSFSVSPGIVTGFLGPNGAGKSTTMRMIVGLDRPTAGSVTVNCRTYANITAPLQEIGARLDAGAVDGRRSARQHLTWIARAGGIPKARIEEVLEIVGLTDVAARPVKGFSLGMSQRLGIATALLGDPGVLLLDEPVNGLDPEGIRWVRRLMRKLADEGRTVVVSSHLMSEMEKTADHVLVIGRGRLVADMPVGEFVTGDAPISVRVVSPSSEQLQELLVSDGATVHRDGGNGLRVTGIDNIRIADLAAKHDVRIHELTPEYRSFEGRFMELTYDSVDYRSSTEGPNS